jgi:hypothetical protein
MEERLEEQRTTSEIPNSLHIACAPQITKTFIQLASWLSKLNLNQGPKSCFLLEQVTRIKCCISMGRKISCNEKGQDLSSWRNLIIVLVRYVESILTYGVIMLAFKLLFQESTAYFKRISAMAPLNDECFVSTQSTNETLNCGINESNLGK